MVTGKTPRILMASTMLFFIISTVFASEPRSLSVEDAVQLALENNSEILKARLSERVARAHASSSWNVFLPDISLTAALRNVHELAGLKDSTRQDTLGNDMSASAGLRLTLQPGVREILLQTGLEKEQQELLRTEVEASVSRMVKKSYFAIATERRRLELYEKNLELAKREAGLVQRNYNAGLASELTLLQARYAAASLEPDLLQVRQEFEQTLRAFNILLGIESDTAVVFTDSIEHNFPEVCLPEDVAVRIEERADVATARIALERAMSRRRAATLNRYAPSVSLSESASVSDLQNGFSAPETGTFTLSVAIPLNGYIPGSATRMDAKELDAVVEQAELALNDTRIQAQEEVRELTDTLNRLQKSIELTRMNETVAVRAYELSREGYESGLVTQTDLDEARQKSLEARFSVLNAMYLYKAALIELAHALIMEESELCRPGE